MGSYLHIVQGESAEGLVFSMLKEHNISNHNIFMILDDLSVGPLIDVDAEIPNSRIEFWENLLENQYDLDIKSMLIATNKELSYLNKSNLPIVVWVGQNASEILLLKRIAYYLRDGKVPLYKANIPLDYPNAILKGQTAIPMLNNDSAWFLYQNIQKLNTNEISELANEWEMLKSQSPISIRSYINGKFNTWSEDYFDENILNMIGNDWIKASYVIGTVMANADFLIGDTYLKYRLGLMVKSNQLELEDTANGTMVRKFILNNK
jgi:hypothetical protein